MSWSNVVIAGLSIGVIVAACSPDEPKAKSQVQPVKVSAPLTCEERTGQFYDLIKNMQKLDYGRRYVDSKLTELGLPSEAVTIGVGIYDVLDQQEWTDSEIAQFKYRFVSNACSE